MTTNQDGHVLGDARTRQKRGLLLLDVVVGAGDESRTRDPGCPQGSTLLGKQMLYHAAKPVPVPVLTLWGYLVFQQLKNGVRVPATRAEWIGLPQEVTRT
ncbi:MAG: hypothetical protein IIB22_11920 [Chloroflexi bacterium]|nr:hypothetical protein [Chloroflexota bacterium]